MAHWVYLQHPKKYQILPCRCCNIYGLFFDWHPSGTDESADFWFFLDHIFTASEFGKLMRLAAGLRERTAVVKFSAIEAFNKCQSSLTHEWIDFDEAAAQVDFADESSGILQIAPQSLQCNTRFGARYLRGRFAFDPEGFVVTGISAVLGASGW